MKYIFLKFLSFVLLISVIIGSLSAPNLIFKYQDTVIMKKSFIENNSNDIGAINKQVSLSIIEKLQLISERENNLLLLPDPSKQDSDKMIMISEREIKVLENLGVLPYDSFKPEDFIDISVQKHLAYDSENSNSFTTIWFITFYANTFFVYFAIDFETEKILSFSTSKPNINTNLSEEKLADIATKYSEYLGISMNKPSTQSFDDDKQSSISTSSITVKFYDERNSVIIDFYSNENFYFLTK